MAKRIVYKEGDLLVVVTPTDASLANHTIDEIAEKDVPSGLPYRIVEDTDISSDRTFRDAWTIADSELTSGTGGPHDVFITDPQHPDYVEPEED